MPIEKNVNVTVSTGMCVAGALWILAAVVLLIGTWLDARTWLSWGLALSGVAMTSQLRHYFARQNHLFRSAFELGRDSAATEAEPTPLRPRS